MLSIQSLVGYWFRIMPGRALLEAPALLQIQGPLRRVRELVQYNLQLLDVVLREFQILRICPVEFDSA
jgi:hypothetical protein